MCNESNMPRGPTVARPAPEGARARGYPSRVPRIYTRTGDDGTTGLLYGGRVSKGDPVPELVGTLDETVALLGLARALTADADTRERLLRLQRNLFVVGADVATNPRERARLEPGVSLVSKEMVAELEASIDEMVRDHPLPNVFVVPGASPASATLDVARSACRRAERRAVAVREGGEVSEHVLVFLNRLSDLLFVMARVEAGETEPASRAPEPGPGDAGTS